MCIRARDGACRGAGVCGAELGAAEEGEVRWFVPGRFLGTDYADLRGFRELHGLVRIIQNLRINTDYTDFGSYAD